jgi:hypothetical protein
MLKGLVRSQRPIISSKDDLIDALRSAHTQMCDVSWRPYFISLVESMPKRLAAIRDAHGGHIHY